MPYVFQSLGNAYHPCTQQGAVQKSLLILRKKSNVSFQYAVTVRRLMYFFYFIMSTIISNFLSIFTICVPYYD